MTNSLPRDWDQGPCLAAVKGRHGDEIEDRDQWREKPEDRQDSINRFDPRWPSKDHKYNKRRCDQELRKRSTPCNKRVV